MGVKPYHIMITPFNQAFQFVENENGSVFGETDDSMVDYDGLQEMCQEKAWDFHSFKACNQFNNQAPGTEMEIHSFCTSRYDITFEQFAKVCVNGENQSELFEFLKLRKGFKDFDMSKPESKYLVHKLEKEEPGYELSSDIKWRKLFCSCYSCVWNRGIIKN